MKITPKKQRSTCKNCKSKRYTDSMILVFKHPILTDQDFYCCNDHECIDGFLSGVLMFQETGLLQVITNVTNLYFKKAKAKQDGKK